MKAKQKGRSILSIVTAVGMVLTLLLTAYGGAAASPARKDPKLVYFIFTGFTYPYFAPMAQGVKAAQKRYKDLNIKIVSANNSASTEITQINEALANGAKGIILNPVQESVTHAAQGAVSKGVPVVTLDRDVTSPSARFAFIGDKDVILGKVQTKHALRYLAQHHVKTPWHVVILEGTLGASTAIDRLKGEMDALKPYIKKGKAKIVLNQSADFATANAQSTVSEFLAKTKDVQLILAGNDAMALGAITAVRSHGLKPGKDVYIAGADAQPESMTAIKDGSQLNTVTHSPYLEAVWAVEAMDNYLTHGVKPPAKKYPHGNVIIPMTLVNTANVNKIAAWGTPAVIPPLPYGHAKPLKTH